MYEYISGKIVEKKTTYVVIDANGIGFYITVPISTYDKLGEVGTLGKLYIRFHVRENEQRLFGFATKEERVVFDSLLKVAGIGPKIAISILSGITINDLFDVISRQDVKLLSTVPGIGKKSSERIIGHNEKRQGGCQCSQQCAHACLEICQFQRFCRIIPVFAVCCEIRDNLNAIIHAKSDQQHTHDTGQHVDLFDGDADESVVEDNACHQHDQDK